MPTASADLQRRLDELHLRYQLRFADHVRLTRDLEQLDVLITEVEAVVEQARQAAPPPEQLGDGQWERLFDCADRRMRGYVEARGAIAQAQSVAGLRDRDASLLTSRARLVLHRYVRHFAGHDRRTRDLGRMDEIIADLLAIFLELRPMMGRIQVPSVGEEIEAVNQFLGFFHAERREIEEAWRSGGRDDQSRALGVVADDLYEAWHLLVADEDRAMRRPALLDRLVGSLDRVLEALMTISHANMAEDHEIRVARAARDLVRWQDEREASAQARQALPDDKLVEGLRQRAQGIFKAWRDQMTGELASRDLGQVRGLCDRLDEVERQLAEVAERSATHADPALASKLAWTRDVLVAMERTYDQILGAQALR